MEVLTGCKVILDDPKHVQLVRTALPLAPDANELSDGIPRSKFIFSSS